MHFAVEKRKFSIPLRSDFDRGEGREKRRTKECRIGLRTSPKHNIILHTIYVFLLTLLFFSVKELGGEIVFQTSLTYSHISHISFISFFCKQIPPFTPRFYIYKYSNNKIVSSHASHLNPSSLFFSQNAISRRRKVYILLSTTVVL